ncbi:MAG TPA: PilZ domain-containing protein [Bacillota bacterium]|nr:PilZ domain-containing protein [Bacillota bacterium]
MSTMKIIRNGGVEWGVLHRLEGEMMEIIIRNTTQYNIKDQLVIEFEGQEFNTHVLKKTQTNLFLFVPVDSGELPLTNRRTEIRIPISMEGQVQFIKGELDESELHKIDVEFHDVSLHGLCFSTEFSLTTNDIYTVFFRSEVMPVSAKVKIRNQTSSGTKIRYGVSIEYINPVKFAYLRKLILLYQLKR